MIIGTLTSGAEQEYLMIAKTRLPINEKLASDVKDFNNKDAIAACSKAENKIEIETKINHQGEVNKARVMPQPNKYNIIALQIIVKPIINTFPILCIALLIKINIILIFFFRFAFFTF